MTKEATCPHLNFNAFVDVGRISRQEGGSVVAYMCDLRIECRECGQEMEFVGLPCGLSFYQPTVSINGDKAHLPMTVPGETIPDGMAGYGVKFTSFEDNPVKQ